MKSRLYVFVAAILLFAAGWWTHPARGHGIAGKDVDQINLVLRMDVTTGKTRGLQDEDQFARLGAEERRALANAATKGRLLEEALKGTSFPAWKVKEVTHVGAGAAILVLYRQRD